MKFINKLILFSLALLLVTSCSSSSPLRGCPDGEIEWVNLVMIQDIKYEYHFLEPSDENTSINFETGKELGKVKYKMAGNACSNHKTKNGDAAYLEVGTPIYEIKGYPSSFIVAADDTVNVSDRNIKAKTAGELYSMENLVKNIYFESTQDGSRIHTFSQASLKKFIKAWYPLIFEDVNSLLKEGKLDGEPIFLEIELKNGVTFRIVYFADTNTFHNGVIGDKEIKEVLDDELAKIKVE